VAPPNAVQLAPGLYHRNFLDVIEACFYYNKYFATFSGGRSTHYFANATPARFYPLGHPTDANFQTKRKKSE
jgi:hypothetical protein